MVVRKRSNNICLGARLRAMSYEITRRASKRGGRLRGEANARESGVQGARTIPGRGGKAKLRRTRRRTASRRTAEGSREDREAHLSLCTSAVRHPGDRSTLSVRRRSPPSSAARRALATEYHVASHLFTLTQYLLGRTGESAVRSFAQLASLFRDRLPSFSPALFDDERRGRRRT